MPLQKQALNLKSILQGLKSLVGGPGKKMVRPPRLPGVSPSVPPPLPQYHPGLGSRIGQGAKNLVKKYPKTSVMGGAGLTGATGAGLYPLTQPGGYGGVPAEEGLAEEGRDGELDELVRQTLKREGEQQLPGAPGSLTPPPPSTEIAQLPGAPSSPPTEIAQLPGAPPATPAAENKVMPGQGPFADMDDANEARNATSKPGGGGASKSDPSEDAENARRAQYGQGPTNEAPKTESKPEGGEAEPKTEGGGPDATKSLDWGALAKQYGPYAALAGAGGVGAYGLSRMMAPKEKKRRKREYPNL